MKTTCETIAVEGGAEDRNNPQPTPAQRYEAEQRTADLLYQAIRHIPRRHRLGWFHAIARASHQPFTLSPTRAERDYLAWSQQRLAGPTRTHSNDRAQGAPTHPTTTLGDPSAYYVPGSHYSQDVTPSDAVMPVDNASQLARGSE